MGSRGREGRKEHLVGFDRHSFQGSHRRGRSQVWAVVLSVLSVCGDTSESYEGLYNKIHCML